MNKAHTFHHEAMKSTFSLRIVDKEASEAAGVARECFELLDYLESRLSRFIEGSDVWQINHLKTGESLFLTDPCYRCLCLATQATEETGGLFDISIGTLIEARKDGQVPPDPHGRLVIDPQRPRVVCEEAGREIDLGGIGKGFALEEMKARMIDWGVESALLAAGSSTQLAFGPQAWRVELTGDQHIRSLDLQDAALSASGTGVQGSHIVSPAGGEPAYPYKRIWITHTNAALADAWSTALMLLSREHLDSLEPEGSSVYVQDPDGRIQQLK